MKKMLSLILAVVLTCGCLAGVSFAADPIAIVTNGADSVEVISAAEIKSFINADGKTVVKMLKDDILSDKGWLTQVPTFTLDLNGHTVGTTKDNTSAIIVNKKGTANDVTRIFGGNIVAGGRVTRIYEGALQMENVVGVTTGVSCTIDMSQRSGRYNPENLITGCTLANLNYMVIAFGYEYMDSSAVELKIENTTLVHGNDAKLNVFSNGTGTISGTVVLGKGVKVYSPRASYANPANFRLKGETLTQTKTGDAEFSLPAQNFAATKLNLWETPAWDGQSLGTAFPTFTGPIAQVINGSDVVEVNTAEEIKAFINPDGTTVIKMLQDYYHYAGTFLGGVPTCTLDLNGHTVQAAGIVLNTKAVGTKNSTTVVKNGTIIASSHGVRSDAGLRVENCTIKGGDTSAIGIYADTPQWNDNLLVTGSTLIGSDWVPIAFNSPNGEQTGVCVKVEDSVLLSYNKHKDNALISTRMGGGEIEFGTGVTMYGLVENYKEAAIIGKGETVTQTATGDASYMVTATGATYTKMNKWETPAAEVQIADFADVAKDFWGYAAIMNAAKAGLVKGKSENTDGTMNYVPNASMTRAEFITVICRYFYPTEAAAVTAGAKWWTGYYDLALTKGILKDDELDYGDLDKAMSREEMALVLSRTAPAQAAYASVTPADAAAIPDYASVGEYYQTAVLWAYGAGLLKGVDTAGTFNPKGELNRAAVATIFNTLLSSK